MFQHILVPLDGSPLAEQALPVAVRLARASGGKVSLLNVVDIYQMYVPYGAMQPLMSQETIDGCIASAGHYLDRLLHREDMAGVPGNKQVVLGNPPLAILAEIDEQAIDLVVMSSHGYAGITRWVMGSTAEKIMHHSPVPVLILHDGKPLDIHLRPDGTSAVRALVPLDASARSQDVIAPAAALVAALSTPGQGALHFLQIVVPPKDGSKEERETLLQQARQNLQTTSENIRDGLVANVGPELHLKLSWSVALEDDIAGGIMGIAESSEKAADTGVWETSDLIAMTTHGYTGIQKWTMGSIAERVLHTTRLPLLLVRPADMIMKEHREKQGQAEPVA